VILRISFAHTNQKTTAILRLHTYERSDFNKILMLNTSAYERSIVNFSTQKHPYLWVLKALYLSIITTYDIKSPFIYSRGWSKGLAEALDELRKRKYSNPSTHTLEAFAYPYNKGAVFRNHHLCSHLTQKSNTLN
jgi:hypothetical protein